MLQPSHHPHVPHNTTARFNFLRLFFFPEGARDPVLSTLLCSSSRQRAGQTRILSPPLTLSNTRRTPLHTRAGE